MPVPRADAALGRPLAVKPATLVSRPSQRRAEFGLKQFLNKAPNARPHPTFQRIAPIVAEKTLLLRGANRRLRAIHRHGVISVGALTPVLVCVHKLEITPLSNFNHLRDGTSGCSCNLESRLSHLR